MQVSINKPLYFPDTFFRIKNKTICRQERHWDISKGTHHKIMLKDIGWKHCKLISLSVETYNNYFRSQYQSFQAKCNKSACSFKLFTFFIPVTLHKISKKFNSVPCSFDVICLKFFPSLLKYIRIYTKYLRWFSLQS